MRICIIVITMAKFVQTEVEPLEYEMLEKILKKKRMTIKEAVREAIVNWIGLQTPISEDPLFKLKPARTGVKTDSSRVDELLYQGLK